MARRSKINVLVAYDVSTVSREGRKRLRKVAIACAGYGQRVQNSLFECCITRAQIEELEAVLLTIINPQEDRLRFYELSTDYRRSVRVHGLLPEWDIKTTIIV